LLCWWLQHKHKHRRCRPTPLLGGGPRAARLPSDERRGAHTARLPSAGGYQPHCAAALAQRWCARLHRRPSSRPAGQRARASSIGLSSAALGLRGRVQLGSGSNRSAVTGLLAATWLSTTEATSPGGSGPVIAGLRGSERDSSSVPAASVWRRAEHRS